MAVAVCFVGVSTTLCALICAYEALMPQCQTLKHLLVILQHSDVAVKGCFSMLSEMNGKCEELWQNGCKQP